jgi:hypothetical protein
MTQGQGILRPKQPGSSDKVVKENSITSVKKDDEIRTRFGCTFEFD